MSLSDHGSPAYTRGLTPVGGCPTKTAPLSRPKRQNMPPHRGRKGFFLSRHRFTPQNFKYNTLLDGLIEQAAFNQALVTHPEDEFASVLVGDLAQFVDTNSGVKIYGSKEEIRARKSPETVDASGFVPDASIPVTLYVVAHRFCCQLSVVLNLMLKLSPVPPSTTSSMSTQDFNPCALSYIFVMGRHL